MACRWVGVLSRTPSPRGAHSDGADVLGWLRVQSGRRPRRGSKELRQELFCVPFGSLVAQRDRYDTSWGAKKIFFLIRDIDGSRHAGRVDGNLSICSPEVSLESF